MTNSKVRHTFMVVKTPENELLGHVTILGDEYSSISALEKRICDTEWAKKNKITPKNLGIKAYDTDIDKDEPITFHPTDKKVRGYRNFWEGMAMAMSKK